MANLQVAEGISIDIIPGFYSPGDIVIYSSNFTPTGFLSCDGSTITQNQYPSLFSVLGTYYDPVGLVCKLPNLNAQADWTFPCGLVGNEVSYGGSSSHTHTGVNATVTAADYTTAAHNHNSDNNSNNSDSNHTHNGQSANVNLSNGSTATNRSNGSGQGVNLSVSAHSHPAGAAYNTGGGTVNHTHYHSSSLGVASAASNHGHSATLSTTANTTSYIPDNVISMRYYIKW